MKVVTLDEVITTCNLVEVIRGLEEGNSATRNYLFLTSDQRIIVETTASKLMSALALLPVELQAQLMRHIAGLVPNPGDSVSLVKKEGGSTNLPAVVTRLKPTGDEVRILITR